MVSKLPRTSCIIFVFEQVFLYVCNSKVKEMPGQVSRLVHNPDDDESKLIKLPMIVGDKSGIPILRRAVVVEQKPGRNSGKQSSVWRSSAFLSKSSKTRENVSDTHIYQVKLNINPQVGGNRSRWIRKNNHVGLVISRNNREQNVVLRYAP